MSRIDALIKGLIILRAYDGSILTTAEIGGVIAGPRNHRDISDEDAKHLDDLGWVPALTYGWMFKI
jgi:hypothetical protein